MQTHGFVPNAVAALGLGATPAETAPDAAALDAAFDALKSYNWGTDTAPLDPIESAAVAALGDPALRKDLETRLAAALEADISRDAKDVVCRVLRKMASASSVPALARMLPDKDLSHMARYALERIDDPAAGRALRDALPKAEGALKAGLAGSLGSRRDAAAVPALVDLLGDDDAATVAAAATALGSIATPEAASALIAAMQKAPAAARGRDRRRSPCRGIPRRRRRKAEAGSVYKACAAEGMPEQVQFAAKRGLSKF